METTETVRRKSRLFLSFTAYDALLGGVGALWADAAAREADTIPAGQGGTTFIDAFRLGLVGAE